jgi:hypothetical protein
VTTLQTADGRLLRAQRPAGASGFAGAFMPVVVPADVVERRARGRRRLPEELRGDLPVAAQPGRRSSTSSPAGSRRCRSPPTAASAEQARDGRHRRRAGFAAREADAAVVTGPSGGAHRAVVADSRQRGGREGAHRATRKRRRTCCGRSTGAQDERLRARPAARSSGGRRPSSTTSSGSSPRRHDPLRVAGPEGGEVGVSPLEKLGVTIRLEDAAQRHQTAMFRNGVRPSLAVSLEDSEPEAEVLEYARQRSRRCTRASTTAARRSSWAPTSSCSRCRCPGRGRADRAAQAEPARGRPRLRPGRPADERPRARHLQQRQELLGRLYRDVVPPWTRLIEQTLQAQLIDPEPAWLDRFVAFDF